MRVVGLTGLAACLAVAGCTPSPGSYYGAPPGYAPQPYRAVPGGAGSPSLPPPDDNAQQQPDPGYSEPSYAPSGYREPAVLAPEPGYYVPPPAYGYAPPPVQGYAPPSLPPVGIYGRRDHFERERLERERSGRELLERGRIEQNRGREQFERERFEQGRFRERMQMERPRPPPPQLRQPAALQGPARPQDFRRPGEGQGRRGLSPEQLRGLR